MGKIYLPNSPVNDTEWPAFDKVPEVHTKKHMVVKCLRLNIRSNPSYSSLVLTILDRGNYVEVRTDDTERNGFIPVRTNSGLEGWAAKQYLE